MASLAQVGGQPGGATIRDVLAVALNDNGTLKASAVTSVSFAGLPTSDPAVVGALYTTAGALMVSAGP